MAASEFPTHVVIALRNADGQSQEETLRGVAGAIRKDKKYLADLTQFDVPVLQVGTLETLMKLSDDTERVDAFIEGVVRRIERQIAEAASATRAFAEGGDRGSAGAAGGGGGGGGGGGSGASSAATRLDVDGKPVGEWLREFNWDLAQWDVREPLPSLVKRMRTAVEAIDTDLRQYVSAYQEKRQALATLDRKRAGNFLTAPLDDVLTEAVLAEAGVEFADTEFFQTQIVVVNKVQEVAFLDAYERLAAEVVPAGPKDDRERVKISPVVPRSARRLTQDNDGYILYAVLVLKKYVDTFRAKAKDARFPVRDFVFDPTKAGRTADLMASLEVEAKASLADLRQQAARQFGECFSIWIHLKAVRTFVEGVLRYGLPVDFAYCILKPRESQGPKVRDALHKNYSHLLGEDEEEEVEPGDAALLGGAAGGTVPGIPMVNLGFDVHDYAAL